jgi:predicted transcriptional regulator
MRQLEDSVTDGQPVPKLMQLATKIVSAYVANNTVAPVDLPGLIARVHAALDHASQGGASASADQLKPVVSIKDSVTPEYIICLNDGKRLKLLKRHLRTVYNMTPDEYRSKWGLPYDYPMVAPKYAASRSALAKKIGLGRQSSSRRNQN